MRPLHFGPMPPSFIFFSGAALVWRPVVSCSAWSINSKGKDPPETHSRVRFVFGKAERTGLGATSHRLKIGKKWTHRRAEDCAPWRARYRLA